TASLRASKSPPERSANQEKKEMTHTHCIARSSFLVGSAAAGAGVPFAFSAQGLAQGLTPAEPVDFDSLERVRVDLLPPPFVHAHDQVATGGPRIVEFRLVSEEKPMVVDDLRTTLRAMTFGGTLPGTLMVV